MLMVIPNEGKKRWLQWAVVTDGDDLHDFTLMLFQNNYQPVDGSTLQDFVESSFPGYQRVFIDRVEMSAPAIAGNVAFTERNVAPQFTCTGGQGEDCYGWYLVDRTDNTLLAAQRFDTKRVMSANTVERIDPFKISLKTFA